MCFHALVTFLAETQCRPVSRCRGVDLSVQTKRTHLENVADVEARCPAGGEVDYRPLLRHSDGRSEWDLPARYVTVGRELDVEATGVDQIQLDLAVEHQQDAVRGVG